MRAKTQIEDVLNHLKTYEKITSMEAINKFGATRLSDIIYRLRKKGHDISTLDTVATNRYGNRVNYATYRFNPVL